MAPGFRLTALLANRKATINGSRAQAVLYYLAPQAYTQRHGPVTIANGVPYNAYPDARQDVYPSNLSGPFGFRILGAPFHHDANPYQKGNREGFSRIG